MYVMTKTQERITIAVTPENHEKLAKIGKFGESMNDVITRILVEYKKSGGGRIGQ
jgi:predicted CopG family antitoxin